MGPVRWRQSARRAGGWLHKRPPPYFAGAGLKQICVAGLGSLIIRDSGPPQPKKAHLLPENDIKVHTNYNCGQKNCFLDSNGLYKPPLTLFVRCLTQKAMY